MLFKWIFVWFIVMFLTKSALFSELKELVVRVVGGPFVAQLLAQETGYYYKGPVSTFTMIIKF